MVTSLYGLYGYNIIRNVLAPRARESHQPSTLPINHAAKFDMSAALECWPLMTPARYIITCMSNVEMNATELLSSPSTGIAVTYVPGANWALPSPPAHALDPLSHLAFGPCKRCIGIFEGAFWHSGPHIGRGAISYTNRFVLSASTKISVHCVAYHRIMSSPSISKW